MKKLLLQSALLAAGFLLLAGCTNVATFDYSAAAEPMVSFAGPPEAKSIAVLPFLDQRSRKSLQQLGPAADSGSFYLGLLPLMPYGYVKKPFPERSDDFVSLGRFHFNPSLDLAEASVLSLKASRLFGRVELADSAGRTDAEYLWRGSVNNTFYSGAMLTYCISYFLSPALWAVGAPEGVSRNALGVSFELVERATGRIVWRYDYDGEDYIVHWIYARIGKDVSLYADLMRQALNLALSDLAPRLPELQRSR